MNRRSRLAVTRPTLVPALIGGETRRSFQMRHLLLASVAMLTLAAPALADSLQTGAGAGVDAGVTADIGGNSANTSAGADVDATIDAETDANANAGGTMSEPATPESTTLPAAGNVATDASGATQTTVTAAQLIGLSVVDVNGESVGEVSNAVLAGNTTAVSQVVIYSGGLFGFGGREVAVDAANLDTSTAAEGTVKLRTLAAADLETMADFKADQSVRLLNPS
jgi:sporulation protein YlmC with PRC-barrel domain